MKVTADQVALSRTHLNVGLKVSGPKDAWVRFALLQIPLTALSVDLVEDLAIRVVRCHTTPVAAVGDGALF